MGDIYSKICSIEEPMIVREPEFVYNATPMTNKDYRHWFADIKGRLKQMQVKAAVRVNTTLLEFYWSIGRDIEIKKKELGWGAGVVKQLSLDLKDAFPDVKGLSYTNLRYTEQWYRFYNQEDTICHQLGGKLEMPKKFGGVPWRHHIEIITKCESVNEALFYIDKVIDGNWSRRQLEDSLDHKLYKAQGAAITNFSDRLPSPQSALAQEMLKDPYNFDFLTLKSGYNEKELEDALVHNITRFLLELGQGFSFVGRQMELRMPGGQTFFPDLIFYHFKLKCFVVVELKVVPFIPEFAGKLNFYVSAAEHLLRGEGDNQTIGLLICKSKDDTIVKWSFQDLDRPIGVAAYDLQEVVDNTIAEMLPTMEETDEAIKQ